MIRVAFFLNFPLDYKGGINYLRNLLYAIRKYPAGLEVILFVPADIPDEYISMFSPYATIVKTKVIQRKSFPWLLDRGTWKIFGFNPLMKWLLSKYKIDAVSHSNYVDKGIKTINWIPDFQYVHYPDLWNEKRLKETTDLHRWMAENSDMICLSSNAAFEDYKRKYNEFAEKVFVLHFVSQPEKGLTLTLDDSEKEALFKKYNIDRPYFYLPNQFWIHKNHKVVWRAVKILKDKGLEPLVITSGFMSDPRNRNEHVETLLKFIVDNNLTNNILTLGLIPYNDVLKLFISSTAVINPSYFEGWSSTVEEAKSMGKRVILSNIDVHVEQKPEYGIYFSPDDDKQLAEIIGDILSGKTKEPNTDKDELLRDLEERTKLFSHTYTDAVKRLLKHSV